MVHTWPSPSPRPGPPLVCFLSQKISLHFQEFYVKESYSVNLIWVSCLAERNYFENRHGFAGFHRAPSCCRSAVTLRLIPWLVCSPVEDLGGFPCLDVTSKVTVNVHVRDFACTCALVSAGHTPAYEAAAPTLAGARVDGSECSRPGAILSHFVG